MAKILETPHSIMYASSETLILPLCRSAAAAITVFQKLQRREGGGGQVKKREGRGEAVRQKDDSSTGKRRRARLKPKESVVGETFACKRHLTADQFSPTVEV